MRRTNKKWRIKTPNQHRTYGEKRNRDFKVQINDWELEKEQDEIEENENLFSR